MNGDTNPDDTNPDDTNPDETNPDESKPDATNPDDTEQQPSAPAVDPPGNADDESAVEVPDSPAGLIRGWGDAALAAAIERSASPRGTTALNIGDTVPLPIPADTANLRLGPGLNDSNLSVLPLVGVWRGEGRLHTPGTAEERVFGQQLTISHDGRGFLRHESVSWLIEPGGAGESAEPVPGDREVGWWRPQHDGTVELIVVGADGVVEVYYGAAQTLASWSLGTDAVVRTTSAPPVAGSTRLYGIVEGKLAYVVERATAEHPLQPHASALLERVAG